MQGQLRNHGEDDMSDQTAIENSNSGSENIDSAPEKRTAGSESTGSKVGVYICYCGGNISDHVDVEAVRERVAKLPDVAVSRTNMFMCSDPGQELIINDLKNGIVDRVVVASCAPSLHETTFRSAIERAGGNPFIYEHANIREQVSWVHHGDPATDKAAILVAAATAKAKLLKPLEPVRVEAKKHTTVIGGGISGMTAALGIADRGIDVALIEKESRLGGQLNRLYRLAPAGESAAQIVETLSKKIHSHDKITVFTGCRIENVEGYVGNFTLSLKSATDLHKQSMPDLKVNNNGENNTLLETTQNSATLETGAIIMATGSKSYSTAIGEFGHGTYEQVITLQDLISYLKENLPATYNNDNDRVDNTTKADGKNCYSGIDINLTESACPPSSRKELTYNGRKIRSIAMIHCVGSRQIPGVHKPGMSGVLNEYCSRTCCSAMLNASLTIRQAFPKTTVYEMYRDIRTYGRGEEELYNSAAENKVIFMRFEAGAEPEVKKNGKKMEAMNSSGNADTSDFPLQVTIQDTLTFGETFDLPVDLVVLAAGTEPNDLSSLVKAMKIPVGSDGFLLEVHPKLRPVEFPVAGIFLAGTCQSPMNAGEASNAAGAAAAKASALLSRGFIELPPFVAEVDEEGCNGCGACVEACLKDGALTLTEIEKGGKKVRVARVIPAVCLGCGACAAVCPESAIDLNGWSLKQYEKMVDAIVAEGMAA